MRNEKRIGSANSGNIFVASLGSNFLLFVSLPRHVCATASGRALHYPRKDPDRNLAEDPTRPEDRYLIFFCSSNFFLRPFHRQSVTRTRARGVPLFSVRNRDPHDCD